MDVPVALPTVPFIHNLQNAKMSSSQEAVNRTKIVLKLLESKAAASSLPQQPNGGGVQPSGNTTESRGNKRNKSGRSASANTRREVAGADKCIKNARKSLPQKHRDCGSSKSTANPAAAANNNNNDDEQNKNNKRNMKKVLRMSTEAYSDRVGQQGGGAARRVRDGGGVASGGGTAGGITRGGGPGGERRRMSAAAQAVQVAFRQRMFHRFVWAQAYLRSPTHTFGLFKRCLHVLHGPANITATASAPRLPAAPGAASTSLETAMNVSWNDAWPEAPGFCVALLHHAHAADSAFLGHVRWRRESSHLSEPSRSITEGMTEPGSLLATATAKAAAGGSAAAANLSTQAQNPQQQPQEQQQRPDGVQLFERKHAIRTAAVRSMLIDLRVPFLPGALDAAMEDLEKTIALESSTTAATTAVGGKSTPTMGDKGRPGGNIEEAAKRFTPGNGDGDNRARGTGGRFKPHHGGGLSFAEWYSWWIRHLPFDPASTGCLLKTVRCAKALHAAENLAASEFS